MAAVSIMGSVGAKPKLGTKLNDAKAVKEVQQLLNKASGLTVVAATGTCGPDTLLAIQNFQKLWGAPDGNVWPGGTTMKRLNRMATPLVVVDPINRAAINQGGYVVAYQTVDKGDLPNQLYRVYLSVGSDQKLLDVTGRSEKGVIGADNLPDLLKLISEQNAWGTEVDCRMIVKNGTQIVTRSEKAAKLPAPVKPYTGKLGGDLLKGANVGDWTYAATNNKGTDGRYLWTTPINGSYFFAYGARLETKAELRGLVCITYIGAVYGVGATESVKNDWSFKDANGNVMDKVNVMSAYGTQLAVHLGAKRVDMEMKKKKDITAFFAEHSTGSYMMWKEGHTVLVIDGKVHEFTNHFGTTKGYHQSDAVNEENPTMEFRYGTDVWWIRELSAPAS